MSEIDNPKALFESTCSTNSEPYALQNIGDMMSPEFSENCIIIVDPAMPIHHHAFVIIDFANGVRANFTLNMFCHDFTEELVVTGGRGRLTTKETFNFHQKMSNFNTNLRDPRRRLLQAEQQTTPLRQGAGGAAMPRGGHGL